MKQKAVRIFSLLICTLLLVATTGIVHVSHFCQMESITEACCNEGDNSCADSCSENCCTTHICVTQLTIHGLLSDNAFSIFEKNKIIPASIFSYTPSVTEQAALKVFTTHTIPIHHTCFNHSIISLRI